MVTPTIDMLLYELLSDKKHLPPSPDDGAKKIVMRITIVVS